MLTERQKKAEVLARELRQIGATATSALPLVDGAPLRFRVLATRAEAVLRDLAEADWDARFVSSAPEFRLDGTTALSYTYEIHLPVERTAVPGDRITGELASSDKGRSAEVEALLKYVRGK